MSRDLVACQRLRQVILRAKIARYLTIEVDVVHVADDQHADIRFDHVSKFRERGQRLVFAADVHDQYARRGALPHGRDGGANAAAAHIHASGQDIRQPLAKGSLGCRVSNESDQRRPPMAGRELTLLRPVCRLTRSGGQYDVGYDRQLGALAAASGISVVVSVIDPLRLVRRRWRGSGHGG